MINLPMKVAVMTYVSPNEGEIWKCRLVWGGNCGNEEKFHDPRRGEGGIMWGGYNRGYNRGGGRGYNRGWGMMFKKKIGGILTQLLTNFGEDQMKTTSMRERTPC
ncbi:hypothetical protein DPMN_065801 [Dreissena polymorpha]|uniref:Uncharacterized protein n=1 Tax=Dreissena polymorpha TaxID=45954 RepID=A0A9D4BRJ8_DREPO|nr:hypothetical protein DPMN_065801 [Dreissena polymorpha]